MSVVNQMHAIVFTLHTSVMYIPERTLFKAMYGDGCISEISMYVHVVGLTWGSQD